MEFRRSPYGSISDTVDEDLPLDMNRDFNRLRAGEHSARTGAGGAASAGPFPDLVRLGQNSQAAAESLARFLDRYIREVSQRIQMLERRTGARRRKRRR